MPAGPDTLTAAVVIADHPDAARSVQHWLGAQGAGIQ